LLEQRAVELASRLVPLECLVPVRRHLERVPTDDDRTGLLLLPQPRHHVREADEGVEVDRLRQPVICAVRKRVAVDREQRLHSDS